MGWGVCRIRLFFVCVSNVSHNTDLLKIKVNSLKIFKNITYVRLLVLGFIDGLPSFSILCSLLKFSTLSLYCVPYQASANWKDIISCFLYGY